ncbi:MAG: agmatine deiminase family protein [Lachnoclostridium sp.]|nr:agmatine deiminase family protein [Lachnoclostridium sp.]
MNKGNDLGLRMPAEWEHHDVILMTWPNPTTDWAETIDEITACYKAIIEEITKYEPVILIASEQFAPDFDFPNLKVLHLPYNDTWIRDYGPITVVDHNNHIRHLDFAFNGWGLKFAADKDNLVTMQLTNHLRLNRINHLGFIIEGGSIESDGKGTIMTTSTCLLSPNRNGDMSRADIEEYLHQTLGVDHVLWVNCQPLQGDDTDAHIDTIARLAPEDTIIYVGCDDKANPNYVTLQQLEAEIRSFKTKNGQSYRLLRLPSPAPIGTDPATYANYLVTPKAVFVPQYDQPINDKKAIEIVTEAYPDRQVIGLDCRALIKQHGSLHCATMQIIL